MARIRTIKPEFPQSESMGRVSRDARLLFLMLFTIVDDAGRTRAASRMLASLLYPYDDDAKDHMDLWLDELQRQGAIRLYDADGNTYLQIEKWLEHQKIDRPSPSRLPSPPLKPRVTLAKPREDAATDLVPSILDQGPRTKDQKKDAPTVPVVPVVVPKPLPIQIPSFIPVEPWEAFVAMRKAKKRPMSDYALKLMFSKLSKLRAASEDIAAVLNQSTLNGWQDVFAVKPEGSRNGQQPANRSFGSTVSHVVRKRAGEGLFPDGDAIAGELIDQRPEGGGAGENLRLGRPVAAE